MRFRRTMLPLLAATLVLPGCTRDGSSTGGTSPAAPSAPLLTLVNVTASISVTSGATGTWNYAGQSVTIPVSGTFSRLRFNWYTFRGTPTAFGTLYVLDREYLGLPGELGPSTPGYLGHADATIEGTPGPLDDVKGEYVLPTQTTLRGGGKYWFYTTKQGNFVASFDTDIYAGGDFYATGYHSIPFRKVPASGRMVDGTYVPPPAGVFLDANFKLQASAK